MIDIENVVFNTVATSIRTQYPNISVYGEYVSSPATFPCVCVVEDDNYPYEKTIDENKENHVKVMYSVTVYSNKGNGKKLEAKSILDSIDALMSGMNFTRTMRSQVPNEDRTIYRIVARYEGVVSKGKIVGNNTVYHIYRS